jgi:hypothetical protein
MAVVNVNIICVAVELFARNDKVGAVEERGDVVCVLIIARINIKRELCIMTKIEKINYFSGELWRDIGGAVEVNPIWAIGRDFPGSIWWIARLKMASIVVLAEDVAVTRMDIFRDELPVKEGGWRARNAGIETEAAENLEADTGAAINTDARIIIMMAIIEGKIKPFNAILIGLEVILAVAEAKIDVFCYVTND